MDGRVSYMLKERSCQLGLTDPFSSFQTRWARHNLFCSSYLDNCYLYDPCLLIPLFFLYILHFVPSKIPLWSFYLIFLLCLICNFGFHYKIEIFTPSILNFLQFQSNTQICLQLFLFIFYILIETEWTIRLCVFLKSMANFSPTDGIFFRKKNLYTQHF